jgi:hypothetical protein
MASNPSGMTDTTVRKIASFLKGKGGKKGRTQRKKGMGAKSEKAKISRESHEVFKPRKKRHALSIAKRTVPLYRFGLPDSFLELERRHYETRAMAITLEGFFG